MKLGKKNQNGKAFDFRRLVSMLVIFTQLLTGMNLPAGALAEGTTLSENSALPSSEDVIQPGQEQQGGAGEEQPVSSAPFFQTSKVNEVQFTLSAPEGVIVPGAAVQIERVSNDEFITCVLKAMELENAGDLTHIYHRIYSFSGAEVNGELHVTVDKSALLENLGL